MQKFIKSKIIYPPKAKAKGLNGTCYITFIVNESGMISDAKILRGVSGCPECDKEALGVIQKMPKWKPGKLKGRKVRVQYNIPIKFTLK